MALGATQALNVAELLLAERPEGEASDQMALTLFKLQRYGQLGWSSPDLAG